MKDVERLRGRGKPPEEVVDDVAEAGRAFEVTPEVVAELAKLGFSPAQVETIKEACTTPLVPGKGEFEPREPNYVFRQLSKAAALSRTGVRPVQSQHATLWAAKDAQQKYLPTIKELEKFFHAKCPEPFRSGLDKRRLHIVLLGDGAEYEAWWQGVSKLKGLGYSRLQGVYADPLRSPDSGRRPQAFCDVYSCVIVLAGLSRDEARRYVACGTARMYVGRLFGPYGCPLGCGLISLAETAACGSPSLTQRGIVDTVWTAQSQGPGEDAKDWALLVRQRMASGQATPLGELLKRDRLTMSLPHYAEAWTLVGLLIKQPAKFGRLVMEINREVPVEAARWGAQGWSDERARFTLALIEKIYGWDEKQLTDQWRADVMGQGNAAGDAPLTQVGKRKAGAGTAAAAANDDKDTRLNMDDIRRMAPGASLRNKSPTASPRGDGVSRSRRRWPRSLAAWASAPPKSTPSNSLPPSRSCPENGQGSTGRCTFSGRATRAIGSSTIWRKSPLPADWASGPSSRST